MKYKLEIDDVFEYLGNDYITIDKVDYNERRFFLTNKLINEEILRLYVICLVN